MEIGRKPAAKYELKNKLQRQISFFTLHFRGIFSYFPFSKLLSFYFYQRKLSILFPDLLNNYPYFLVLGGHVGEGKILPRSLPSRLQNNELEIGTLKLKRFLSQGGI